jgi:hypothetical protein
MLDAGGTPFRQNGPFCCHPDEMSLPSGIAIVARQLQGVRCQAQAFQSMLSQIFRLGHSAPP